MHECQALAKKNHYVSHQQEVHRIRCNQPPGLHYPELQPPDPTESIDAETDSPAEGVYWIETRWDITNYKNNAKNRSSIACPSLPQITARSIV
jgi:hypothetical protein